MSALDRSSTKVRRESPLADLERGRECFQLGVWSDACEAFAAADRLDPLAAADLERFATSAFLVGRDADYLKALERAHHRYAETGETRRSVRCTFWLGFYLWLRGDNGQASGWYSRGERLLKGEAEVCIEHGYLLLPVVEEHLSTGDFEAAYTAADRAAEIGERFEDIDLAIMARHQQGRARLGQARLAEGLALLDEVMITVVSGRLSPIVTGLMYCSIIACCADVYALGRASEWTSALACWCDAHPQMAAFSGPCLVHRAEIFELAGAWTSAMNEARRVSERPAMNPRMVGAALCRVGDLHRLSGEFAEAEEAYRRASRAGCDPQPGLALLRLAQGRGDVALTSIRTALKAAAESSTRSKLLPSYVDILLACGAIEEAGKASAELESLASAVPSEVLGAIAAQARGAVELANGDPQAALLSLRRAVEVWRKLDAPYVVAKIRLLVGLAYRDLGDQEGSALEMEAAKTAFEGLGAAPDVARIEALTRSKDSERRHGLTARELEVLRLVAAGKTNKAIALQLFVSERTIDRHVSNLFCKLRVSTRAAATAYAYEHHMI